MYTITNRIKIYGVPYDKVETCFGVGFETCLIDNPHKIVYGEH